MQVAQKAAVSSSKWPMITGALALVGLTVGGGLMGYFQSKTNKEFKASIFNVEEKLEIDTASLGVQQEAAKTRLTDLDEKLKLAETQRADDAAKLRNLESTIYRHRDEVSSIETQIRSAITSKDVAVQAKLEGLGKKLQNAQEALTKAEAEAGDIKSKLSLSDLEIDSLKKQTAKLASETAFDPTALEQRIVKLETKPAPPNPTEQFPAFKTVVGGNTAGVNYVFQLDTATGQVRYWAKNLRSNPPGIILAPNIPNGDPGIRQPGRFDIKITFNSFRNVNDIVLLDTQWGLVWNWRPNPSNWRINWNSIGVAGAGGAIADSPIRNGFWRIDVDTARTRGSNPDIILTNTKMRDRIYTDSRFSRVFLLQLR